MSTRNSSRAKKKRKREASTRAKKSAKTTPGTNPTTTPENLHDTRPVYLHNDRSACGNHAGRRADAKNKRTIRRIYKPQAAAAATAPQALGQRGADLTPAEIKECARIFFKYTTYDEFDPRFANKMPRLMPSHPHILVTKLKCEAFLESRVTIAMPNSGREWKIKTIREAAKRWREDYLRTGDARLAGGLPGSSRRDGRAPTNKKLNDNAEQRLKDANDKLEGGGSYEDLAREYNKICRRKGLRKSARICTSTAWNWVGELGWNMHRRWIKPLLSEQHKAKRL